ncbi:MAG: hypothetical protein QOI19_836 [Thermoleophilaceae bacterium]|jgi:hypothetical protein|nr:hypothetical protein [Thermoleophilaceae bacterium]
MSQYVHRHSPAIGVRFRSRSVAWMVGLLLLLAVVATTTVLVANSNDSSSPSALSVTKSASGPNEDLRGISAATSAGASDTQPAGGPNETLRGQATAPNPHQR